MADVCEAGNLTVALTSMANGMGNASALAAQEFQAAAAKRTRSADQLALNSEYMWSIHMTTPTVMAGMGYRTATESGSGRTRLEANRPVESGVADNPK